MFRFFKIDLGANDIAHVREQILAGILYLFLVLGLFALIAAGIELYYQGDWELVYVYLTAYLPVVCCLALKRFLSYRVRVSLILLSLYFLSVFILGRVGLSGAGISLLITFTLLSTVLLGIRAGLTAMLLGLLSIIFIGLCMSFGIVVIDISTMANSTKPVAWTVASILFVIIGIIMVVCPGVLQMSLIKDVAKAKRSEGINKTLYSIANAVNITLDLPDLYQHIHHLLGNILDTTNFFIAIVDYEENILNFPYFVDTDDDDFYPVLNFSTDDSLTGMVVSLKKPLLLRKEELKERSLVNGVHGPIPLIWMGVPLIVKGVVMGVIALQSYTDSDLYNEYDLQMLSAISDQTAIAIDRKQSHEELKKEQKTLLMTLDSNPHGIALIDKNQRYLYVNSRFTEITGYLLEDIPTRKEWFEKAYPDPEYRKEVISIWEIDRDALSAREDFEFVIHTKEGLEKTIEFRGTFSKDIIISVLTDVTERKKAEKTLAELEQKLLQSQKMESLGMLAGGVAHDLNNVLSGVVGYPDLILMDLPKDSPLRQPIIGIQNSGQKAADIVQDLLTLARRGVQTTQIICLNDLIEQYLDSPEHKKLCEFHPNIKIELFLDKKLSNIEGSVLHLVKTIMNLVSNAAEAQVSNAHITIFTSNFLVEKSAEEEGGLTKGDYVLMKISDKGTGIPQGDLNKIFEPFYTKKAMGRSGTGLGMAVVWGTVKDHNGVINVGSEVGKGTVFDLYFPVTDKKDTGTSEKPIEKNQGNKERILIVDDILEQREIASKMLERLNYSVADVSSGEESVGYIKKHEVDLVILDMIMDPGIDGLETYKRIADCNPEQKVLIASGFSENERVKEAQRLGAGEYLKKPYTFEKLGLAVKKALNQ